VPPDIPGLELGALIGSGGFAAVYRARQVSVDREVAVKVDSRRLLDERDRRRFAREARTAGRISAHPNIVTIYDAGTTPDLQPYLVMEYCPGGSLADEMRRRGPLPESEVVPIGLAIADALTAAHDSGILHRDVKPANILLTEYGSPALADFGLAMLPQEGEESMSVTLTALTPSYAPPEAFQHAAPTPSADVWALGATLYALLRGQPPHWNEGSGPPIGVLLGLLQRPLPPLDVPHTRALMEVIWAATDPDPARRYGSAEQLRAALADAAAEPYGGAVPAAAPTVAPALPSTEPMNPPTLPLAPPDARHRPWWPVLATGITILVASLLVALATERGSRGPLSTHANGTSQTSTPSFTTPTTGGARDPTRFVGFATGRCYGDLATTDGVRTARRVPCSGPHRWETFAVGQLDRSTNSPTTDAIAGDPTVRSTCTTENLDQYLGARTSHEPKHGPKPPNQAKGNDKGGRHGPSATYRIAVLGPDRTAFAAGARAFGCLAGASGQQVTGSLRP
jgi:serine/threonine protein kinase